jgi:hypothetical protein
MEQHDHWREHPWSWIVANMPAIMASEEGQLLQQWLDSPAGDPFGESIKPAS